MLLRLLERLLLVLALGDIVAQRHQSFGPAIGVAQRRPDHVNDPRRAVGSGDDLIAPTHAARIHRRAVSLLPPLEHCPVKGRMSRQFGFALISVINTGELEQLKCRGVGQQQAASDVLKYDRVWRSFHQRPQVLFADQQRRFRPLPLRNVYEGRFQLRQPRLPIQHRHAGNLHHQRPVTASA